MRHAEEPKDANASDAASSPIGAATCGHASAAIPAAAPAAEERATPTGKGACAATASGGGGGGGGGGGAAACCDEPGTDDIGGLARRTPPLDARSIDIAARM